MSDFRQVVYHCSVRETGDLAGLDFFLGLTKQTRQSSVFAPINNSVSAGRGESFALLIGCCYLPKFVPF